MKKITDKQFQDSINRLAATEDGQKVFAWLKHSCNWDATLMASDPAMTQHYASIRGVWGKVRQYIDPKYLKTIEFDIKIENKVLTKKAGK
jgi:hypothetical protein